MRSGELHCCETRLTWQLGEGPERPTDVRADARAPVAAQGQGRGRRHGWVGGWRAGATGQAWRHPAGGDRGVSRPSLLACQRRRHGTESATARTLCSAPGESRSHLWRCLRRRSRTSHRFMARSPLSLSLGSGHSCLSSPPPSRLFLPTMCVGILLLDCKRRGSCRNSKAYNSIIRARARARARGLLYEQRKQAHIHARQEMPEGAVHVVILRDWCVVPVS